MKIVSVNQMRNLDRQAIESGISGETLMERAGQGAFLEICDWLSSLDIRHRRRAVILAGKGNNGGDAYVVARYLAQETDLRPVVYSVCPIADLKGEARLNAERLPAEVPVEICSDSLPDSALAPDVFVVDGLLGTGISGPVREPYQTLISQVNNSGLATVALDIPSGLNGDQGKPEDGTVLEADLTIIMGLPKVGLFTPSGRAYTGTLRHVDIGLPPAETAKAKCEGLVDFAADIKPLLSRRPTAAHKNSFGRVLVAAGSSGYGGAPILAAEGALRSGAGVVQLVLPESKRIDGHDFRLPAALIVQPVPAGKKGFFNRDSIAPTEDLLSSGTVLVFGPGAGTRPETGAFLAALLEHDNSAIIDADGLNLIAAAPDTFKQRLAGCILTPHPGEMRRLLESFGLTEFANGPRTEQAAALASETGAVTVLKGVPTVTADPNGDQWLNSSGCPGLASAGTGDVLAGLIGGILAQQKEASLSEAARIGVFVHGLAAELGGFGQRAFTADDLPNAIASAFKKITPFA